MTETGARPGSGAPAATDRPSRPGRAIQDEHGFWDYTCPASGGCEGYGESDYLALLDDMQAAGMNSLVLMVKWWTTGYRSRLGYLDQLPGNRVIESGNDLLRFVLGEASARGIRCWLGAVVTFYPVDRFGGTPSRRIREVDGYRFPFEVGTYDADAPEVRARAVEVVEELVDLFPEASGLVVEVEHAGREGAHRVGPYDAWAAEHGRPTFAELKAQPFDVLEMDRPAWREYTTDARAGLLQAVERAVRARGFEGDLATICESRCTPFVLAHEVDLDRLRRALPTWTAIVYDYAKWRHRAAVMDFLLEQPAELGMRPHYLARGVMTDRWNPWPLPIGLREHWRMDAEDIGRLRPAGVWWYGSGTVGEGANTSLARVREAGFADGRAARRALLGSVGHL